MPLVRPGNAVLTAEGDVLAMAIPSIEAQAVLDMMSNVPEAAPTSVFELSPEDVVIRSRAMSVSVPKLQGVPQQLHSIENYAFEVGGGPLTMRLYRPAAGLLPALLFFYGGGYISGTLESYDTIVRTVAKRTGWIVAAAEYRLAPEHPYPAATEDGYAALVSLSSLAPSLGVDARRIVTVGESAGGTLAAVVALMARDRQGPTLAGMICLEPACDLRDPSDLAIQDAYPSRAENDGMIFSFKDAAKGIGLYLPNPGDRSHSYASPGLAPNLSGLPPSLILTAECDPLRDEGNAFAERLRKSGVVVESACLKGTVHAVMAFLNLMPNAGGELLSHVEQFLHRLD